MDSRIRHFSKMFAVLTLLVFSSSQFVEAQTPAEDGLFLLTYEVGDLTLNIPDYPNPSGSGTPLDHGRSTGRSTGGGGGGFSGGAGGGGFFSVADEAQSSSSGSNGTTMDDLERVLVSTVAPDSWGQAEVQQFGSSLVVRQTKAVHEQIANLLKQLRDGAVDHKTVSVDARWLLLNSDERHRLMPFEQPTDREIPPEFNRDELASFTRRPTSIRGFTNCFSGQLVYLVSGTRRNIVESYIPVVGGIHDQNSKEQWASSAGRSRVRFAQFGSGSGAGEEFTKSPSTVGYQPVVRQVNFGALLEIRPTLLRGKNAALVNVRSTLTTPGKRSGNLAEESSLAPAIDRVAIDTQQFATTLRIPLGRPVLVSGLTYASASVNSMREEAPSGISQEKGATKTKENRQIYLVLEVK